MSRFWFFGEGGKVFIATTECGTPESARRLAVDYNRQPGPLGPIDLITDAERPEEAMQRFTIETSPPPNPARPASKE